MKKYIHWKPEPKNVRSTGMLLLSCQHLGNPACRSGHYPGSWVSAKPHTLWEICVLTQLAHFQDLTQHLGQLYTTAAKGTFMLIFSATVLKHNLQAGKGTGQKGKSVCRKHQKCWLYYEEKQIHSRPPN